MSLMKTMLIAAALSTAVASAASADSVRGASHRGQAGDQNDLITAPPATSAPNASRSQPASPGKTGKLYLSTQPPVHQAPVVQTPAYQD